MAKRECFLTRHGGFYHIRFPQANSEIRTPYTDEKPRDEAVSYATRNFPDYVVKDGHHGQR